MSASPNRVDSPLIPGMQGGISPSQLYWILRRRWLLILAAVIIMVFLSGVLSLVVSKVYQAGATVLIDFQTDDPITGKAFPQFLSESYVATQIDLLKSLRVRVKVVEDLNMTADEKARRKFESASKGTASFKEWLAGRMLKNLEVEVGRESRIIEVAYTADDPQRAAAIANAVVRAYRDANLQLSEDPARDRQSRYKDYLASLRADVETAQKDLTQAQQDLGVLNLEEAGRVDTQRMEDLGIKLNAAQSDSQAAQSKVRRIRQLKREGKSLTAQAEILNSNYVQELKGRLVELEAMRADLSETLGSRHPKIRAIGAEIDTVRRRLRDEVDNYIESNRGEARSAAEREAAIRQNLESERQDVLEVQRKRDEIAEYVRELESAKTLYQAALERYDQVLGGSELTQTNVTVLSWASPPQDPSRPNTKLNLIAGLFLGLILGIGLALLLELVGRRVRTSEDVERELDLDVLGVIPG